jgi:peptidyl-prolyl cis-trans isomerase C
MINTIKKDAIAMSTTLNGTLTGNARVLAIGALLFLTLAACSDNKSEIKAAVLVNGQSLSAAEVKMKLSQYDHLPPERKSFVEQTVLKSLVDTELMRQAALEEGIDKDEIIRARMDNSIRLILAEAYMEKKAAEFAKPSEAEIKAYFDQHPELYAERKIFELEELMVQISQDEAAEVKEKLGDGKNYNEFVAWLAQKQIVNNSQPVSAAAEDMREDILGRLKNVKADDVITLEEKDQLSVIRVKAVHDHPLPFEQAKPMIEAKIYKQRRIAGTDSLLKQLRDKAKIEYVAPYSESGLAAVKPK